MKDKVVTCPTFMFPNDRFPPIADISGRPLMTKFTFCHEWKARHQSTEDGSHQMSRF